MLVAGSGADGLRGSRWQHVYQLGWTGNVVQLEQVAQSRDLPKH